MKRLLPITALLLCISMRAAAQEEFVPPQSHFITRFPFTQLSGGIIIIRAQFDQFADSLNFVLDTGSGGISIDSATARAMNLHLAMSNKTIRGIAGLKTVEFTYNHSLKFPGLTVDNLDFHINDYELLTSVYGVKIDGIVGFSFLRRYIVRIDNDEHQIEVYTPGIFKYPRGGYMLRPDFSTLPLQMAGVSDEKSIFTRFIFDTGAGLNFLLSKDFVEDSSVLKKNKKLYPTQAEGLGGKKLMELTVIREVKVGPYKFKKVPVHIFEDEFNVTSYPLQSGLIGNDIMRRFNVVLNYPERIIFIKPNNHFGDPFDYSYTGLGIYLQDGEVRVIDVIKGSPGEKAGFLPGDVIFSIESNFSKNIQTYKNIFQNATGRMRVIVFRNDTPVSLVIDVKDIRK